MGHEEGLPYQNCLVYFELPKPLCCLLRNRDKHHSMLTAMQIWVKWYNEARQKLYKDTKFEQRQGSASYVRLC